MSPVLAHACRVCLSKNSYIECIYVSFTKFPQLLKGSFRDDIAFKLKLIFFHCACVIPA